MPCNDPSNYFIYLCCLSLLNKGMAEFKLPTLWGRVKLAQQPSTQAGIEGRLQTDKMLQVSAQITRQIIFLKQTQCFANEHLSLS